MKNLVKQGGVLPNNIGNSLPAMISKAASDLAKATTAAEILDAKEATGFAYDAAKRLAYMQGAHDTVRAACFKVMGEALVIAVGADCRLADEYDAAQERGEVQKHGGQGKRDIPNKNIPSAVTDIGLDSKTIHQARKVRDAEKVKPGAIKKALEEKINSGRGPTHTDVTRAADEVMSKEKKQKGSRTNEPLWSDRVLKEHDKAAAIIALMDDGMALPEIAAKTEVGQRQVRHILDRERVKREAEKELLDQSTLPDKYAQRVEAIKRRLEADFDHRVKEAAIQESKEMTRIYLEDYIQEYNKKYEHYKKVIEVRKGIMTKAEYTKIIRCLHPDWIQDESRKPVYEAAFHLFTKLEKLLLDEKESPTSFMTMPRSVADLMEMRRRAEEAKKAKRAAAGVVRR